MSRLPKKLSLFFLSSLILAGCQRNLKETVDIIIQNGKIIDLETGQIAQKDIYISNGRIKNLENSDSPLLYNGNKLIDAEGKYILPGFWDNHVHFRGGKNLISNNRNFLKLFIANGITTVRDAGGDLTPSVLQWKKTISEGNLTGPDIFTSGPKIDGPNATWAGSLEVDNELDVQKALDSLLSLKTDFVKLYDSRISGELYLKTIEEAEKRGLITSGHMPFTVNLDETIEAGIDAIEHLYYVMKGCSSMEANVTKQLQAESIGFWGAMPLLLDSYEESTAEKTFALLKANNVYVVPTLYIGKVLSYLDEVDHKEDTYLKYLEEAFIKTYEGRINGALRASAERRKERKNLDHFFGELTNNLNQAGVGILAGSDCGAYNSYVYPGISLHKELEALVNAGMSPLEALKASAYNGSRFLKKDTDYGSIAEGKISDLVLLAENPLENISNTQKIDFVIKGDAVYNSEELGILLKEAVIEKN
jgi:imidazolonepropionase-like amidohydrolase